MSLLQTSFSSLHVPPYTACKATSAIRETPRLEAEAQSMSSGSSAVRVGRSPRGVKEDNRFLFIGLRWWPTKS